MKNLLSFLVVLCLICGCNREKPDVPPLPPLPVPMPSTPIQPAPEASIYWAPSKVVDAFKGVEAPKIELVNKKGQFHLSHMVEHKKFLSSKLMKRMESRKKMKLASPSFSGKGYVDLRDHATPIVSQWDGTCTAHGITAAIETTIGRPTQKLSERAVWDAYRVYSCDAAIEAWSGTKKCVSLDSAWPHDDVRAPSGYKDPKKCYSYLNATTSLDDDLQKMIDALDKGHAVYLGISVTKSLLNCDVAVNPNSKVVNGGHALGIVGYKIDPSVTGGGYFIIKQSWGDDCGDKGYQYIPFNYCQRDDMYCVMWSIDDVQSVIP